MKKLLFIFNPHSGRAQIKTNLLNIIDKCVKAGYRVEVYPTQEEGDAIRKIRKDGSRFDHIICSGGDGTLNETINGLMHLQNRPTLGYIPSGSTNDFAASLLLPKKMSESIDVAINGTDYPVDVGRFNKKSFVYIAAFGAFTEVSYSTPQDMKNVLGHQAYIIEGIKQLSKIRPYKAKVIWENKELEGEYLYAMVTNATSAGGFKGITGKDVSLNDGLYEVTLIKNVSNPIELNEIIGALMGIIPESKFVVNFKTASVRFESEEEIPWVLDGEFAGDHKIVDIANEHCAIKIKS